MHYGSFPSCLNIITAVLGPFVDGFNYLMDQGVKVLSQHNSTVKEQHYQGLTLNWKARDIAYHSPKKDLYQVIPKQITFTSSYVVC